MMIPVESLPHLNALLNGSAAIFLVAGYYFIKKENKKAHKACMISALTASTLFLVSYLTYHYNVGSVKFQGTGMIRPVYFSILISHTVLAVVVAPMILVTLYRAIGERFDDHRRLARKTWPIWIYVSITGIVVYLMVHRLYQ